MVTEAEREEELELSVERGVKLLDKEFPEWETKISLDSFNIKFSDKCILGQLYWTYGDGLETLGLSNKEGRFYGFDATMDMSYRWGDYDILQSLWRRKIEAMQEE